MDGVINLGEPVGYEDVMLDWAIAEALSPTVGHRYSLSRGLMAMLRASGSQAAGIMDAAQKTELLHALLDDRENLFANYDCRIEPDWLFWRTKFAASDLSAFAIIRYFAADGKIGSLGELAKALPNSQVRQHETTARAANQMLDLVTRGESLNGTPIAIRKSADAVPLLVEGYKRCIVAIWMKRPSLALFVCEPQSTLKEEPRR